MCVLLCKCMLQGPPSYGHPFERLPPAPWLSYSSPGYHHPAYDQPPYDPLGRRPVSRPPYDPYMDRPGFSRFSERAAVFEYMDHRDTAGRYGDRALYDSASQTASRTPQVVDYNHGSLSGKSSDDRIVISDRDQSISMRRDVDRPTSLGRDVDLRDIPQEEDRPITSGRDIDLRDMAKDRDWPVRSLRDVDERPSAAESGSRNPVHQRLEDKASTSAPRNADVDIKFIQDTIVSVHDITFCSDCMSMKI